MAIAMKKTEKERERERDADAERWTETETIIIIVAKRAGEFYFRDVCVCITRMFCPVVGGCRTEGRRLVPRNLFARHRPLSGLAWGKG